MHRRALLAGLVGSLVTTLVGCLGDGSGGDGDGTATRDTTTTSGLPTVTDGSFTVVSNECGGGANSADVRVTDTRVTVEGTIGGRNGCYTAALDGVTYDAGTDTLTVAVRSFDPDPGRVCTQCLVDVEYRAEVAVSGRAPGTVRVTHNGDPVAVAR